MTNNSQHFQNRKENL